MSNRRSKKQNKPKNTTVVRDQQDDTTAESLSDPGISDQAMTVDDTPGVAYRLSRLVVQLVVTFLATSFLMRFGVLFAATESHHAFEDFAKTAAQNPDTAVLNPALDSFAAVQAISAAMGAASLPMSVPIWIVVGRMFDALVRWIQRRNDTRAVSQEERASKVKDRQDQRSERKRQRRAAMRAERVSSVKSDASASSEPVELTGQNDTVSKQDDMVGSTRA